MTDKLILTVREGYNNIRFFDFRTSTIQIGSYCCGCSMDDIFIDHDPPLEPGQYRLTKIETPE